jgi:hypothetical protein
VLALGVLSTAIALAALSLGFMPPEIGRYAVWLGAVLLPVALTTVLLGWRQGVGTRSGSIDPTGRRKSRPGQILGAVALVLWAAVSGFVLVSWPGDEMALMSDGTSVVSEFYRFHHPKARYQQTFGSDGHFVSNGPSVRWFRNGQKLEEGSYRDGKREGMWTFWNEDGTIDGSKTGLYENDVLVRPSPLITR